MLMRRNPFSDLHQMQQEFNRMFEGAFKRQNGFAETRFPGMDVSEAEGVVTVRLLVPGLKKDDIQISLQQNVLTIKGEKTTTEMPEDTRPIRRERTSGAFHRTVRLKHQVDEKEIEANLKEGVLTIRLPYRAEVKPRTIEVAVA